MLRDDQRRERRAHRDVHVHLVARTERAPTAHARCHGPRRGSCRRACRSGVSTAATRRALRQRTRSAPPAQPPPLASRPARWPRLPAAAAASRPRPARSPPLRSRRRAGLPSALTPADAAGAAARARALAAAGAAGAGARAPTTGARCGRFERAHERHFHALRHRLLPRAPADERIVEPPHGPAVQQQHRREQGSPANTARAEVQHATCCRRHQAPIQARRNAATRPAPCVVSASAHLRRGRHAAGLHASRVCRR